MSRRAHVGLQINRRRLEQRAISRTRIWRVPYAGVTWLKYPAELVHVVDISVGIRVVCR